MRSLWRQMNLTTISSSILVKWNGLQLTYTSPQLANQFTVEARFCMFFLTICTTISQWRIFGFYPGCKNPSLFTSQMLHFNAYNAPPLLSISPVYLTTAYNVYDKYQIFVTDHWLSYDVYLYSLFFREEQFCHVPVRYINKYLRLTVDFDRMSMYSLLALYFSFTTWSAWIALSRICLYLLPSDLKVAWSCSDGVRDHFSLNFSFISRSAVASLSRSFIAWFTK